MKNKTLHFLVLVVMLMLGVGLFYYVGSNPGLQMLIGLITAAGYVAWGIIHHIMEGDLHPRLVIEYILIAAIVVVLLYTVAL